MPRAKCTWAEMLSPWATPRGRERTCVKELASRADLFLSCRGMAMALQSDLSLDALAREHHMKFRVVYGAVGA